MTYAISPLMRRAVLSRDRYMCACCGASPLRSGFDPSEMRVEHRDGLPVHEKHELITMCPNCSDGRQGSEEPVSEPKPSPLGRWSH